MFVRHKVEIVYRLTKCLVLCEFVCLRITAECDGGANGSSGSSWEMYRTGGDMDGIGTYWKHPLTRAAVSYSSLVRGHVQTRTYGTVRSSGIAYVSRCQTVQGGWGPESFIIRSLFGTAFRIPASYLNIQGGPDLRTHASPRSSSL